MCLCMCFYSCLCLCTPESSWACGALNHLHNVWLRIRQQGLERSLGSYAALQCCANRDMGQRQMPNVQTSGQLKAAPHDPECQFAFPTTVVKFAAQSESERERGERERRETEREGETSPNEAPWPRWLCQRFM